MANPQAIDFQIGGKTYTYLLGTYGLAKLEQRLNVSWQAIIGEHKAFGALLALFHCGLLLHHEPITEKEASVLLDELTLEVFVERFNQAMAQQFPAAKEGAEQRPTPAANRANGGMTSSASG